MNNALYIGISLSSWYYYDIFAKYILNNKFHFFLFMQSIYWSIGLSYLYMDTRPAIFLKYSNSKNHTNKPKIKVLLPVIIPNHIISGLSYILYSSLTSRGLLLTECPSIMHLSINSLLFFGLFDIIFYIGHRTIHQPYFYSYIHKLHHTTYANTAISGYYMGKIDYILEFMVPVYLSIYIINANVLVFFVCTVIASINGLISHSGYNLPGIPYSKAHLYHHLEFNNNYGTIFMDSLFCTKRLKN